MNDYWFITIVTIRLSLHVNDYYYYCSIIIIITIIIITIIITERAARKVYSIHGESSAGGVSSADEWRGDKKFR